MMKLIMNHLAKLIDHLEWADTRVLESLRNCRRPLPAAISLYSHVLGAEHTWLRRISGESPAVAVWPDLSLDECEALARENAATLRQLVASMTAHDLDKAVTYRNSTGAEFTTGFEDILLHAAMHGSYHRGQVAALLRSAGEEPAPTDYIHWVRGVAAATRARD
jgi:uncharacterized damage-inducible protein DinB